MPGPAIIPPLIWLGEAILVGLGVLAVSAPLKGCDAPPKVGQDPDDSPDGTVGRDTNQNPPNDGGVFDAAFDAMRGAIDNDGDGGRTIDDKSAYSLCSGGNLFQGYAFNPDVLRFQQGVHYCTAFNLFRDPPVSPSLKYAGFEIFHEGVIKRLIDPIIELHPNPIYPPTDVQAALLHPSGMFYNLQSSSLPPSPAQATAIASEPFYEFGGGLFFLSAGHFATDTPPINSQYDPDEEQPEAYNPALIYTFSPELNSDPNHDFVNRENPVSIDSVITPNAWYTPAGSDEIYFPYTVAENLLVHGPYLYVSGAALMPIELQDNPHQAHPWVMRYGLGPHGDIVRGNLEDIRPQILPLATLQYESIVREDRGGRESLRWESAHLTAALDENHLVMIANNSVEQGKDLLLLQWNPAEVAGTARVAFTTELPVEPNERIAYGTDKQKDFETAGQHIVIAPLYHRDYQYAGLAFAGLTRTAAGGYAGTTRRLVIDELGAIEGIAPLPDGESFIIYGTAPEPGNEKTRFYLLQIPGAAQLQNPSIEEIDRALEEITLTLRRLDGWYEITTYLFSNEIFTGSSGDIPGPIGSFINGLEVVGIEEDGTIRARIYSHNGRIQEANLYTHPLP